MIQCIKHIGITEFYILYIETIKKRVEDKIINREQEILILDFIDIKTNVDLYVRAKYIIDDFQLAEIYNTGYRDITIKVKSEKY